MVLTHKVRSLVAGITKYPFILMVEAEFGGEESSIFSITDIDGKKYKISDLPDIEQDQINKWFTSMQQEWLEYRQDMDQDKAEIFSQDNISE